MNPPPRTRLPLARSYITQACPGETPSSGSAKRTTTEVAGALDIGRPQRLAGAHPHLHRLGTVEVRSDPVDVVERDLAPAERAPGTDDDAARLGLQPHDVERIVVGAGAFAQGEAATLADGEAHDAVVPADNLARHVHDVARLGRLRPQLLHHRGIVAVGHEADVLAVGLLGDRQVEALGEGARLALGHVAQRKAQEVELLGRGAEEKVALVARRIGGAMQLRTRLAHHALHIVAGGQRLGAELARGLEQVAELHRAVAGDAGHRRLAAHIGVGEGVHHLGAEAALIVEHVVRDAEPLGDLARVLDVLAGTARPCLADGDAMVIELQSDAHDVVALLLQERGGDRRIDAARHGDDHAGVARRLVDIEGIPGHGRAYIGPARMARQRG